MSDRPEEFRYDLGFGIVRALYLSSWEVDLEAEDGGLVQRALVIGQRFPEISTKTRPQWAIFAYASHQHGRAICWPIESRLPGTRSPRSDLVWWDETLNYRISINRKNELEITNTTADGRVHQIRIFEDGGVIRLDTPNLRLVMHDQNETIDLESSQKINVKCVDADVQASNNATVQVGNDAQVDVGANADVTVGANATLAVGANADVTIGGNATLTAGGVVAVTSGAVTWTAPTLTINGIVTINGMLLVP